MTTAETYFLAVAKHQSIARASEALYVSHQNLSNYMKKLEDQYGLLFIRKPRFKLTPAGQAVYETLRQMEILETGLQNRLLDLNQSERGTLQLGMHASRAQILMPEVLPRFRARYPNIDIVLHAQDNIHSRRMLADGGLDLYLGVDEVRYPEFRYEFLLSEPIRLAISDLLLQSEGIPVDSGGISFRDLSRFPLIANPPESHFRSRLDSFFERVGITVRPGIITPDFFLQLTLAAQGTGICFYPQSMQRHIETLNLTLPADRQLRLLSVTELNETTDLTIVTHRLAYLGKPLQEFCRLLKETICARSVNDSGL